MNGLRVYGTESQTDYGEKELKLVLKELKLVVRIGNIYKSVGVYSFIHSRYSCMESMLGSNCTEAVLV